VFDDYNHSALNLLHSITIPTVEIQKSVQEHIQTLMPQIENKKKKNKRKKNKNKNKLINNLEITQ